MSSKNKTSKEKILLRSGDILNSLGILRSAHLHDGIIKKEEFIELIKKNHLLDQEELPNGILVKLDDIWSKTITLFNEMGINNNSTPNEIKIRQINIFS